MDLILFKQIGEKSYLQLIQMRMVISQLLIIAIIITKSTCITSSPSWIRDPFIDAGQVKVVDIQFMPSSKVSANTTQILTQNYNKTNFSSPPRVILGMIGYGVLPAGNLSSTQIGFFLNITSKTILKFTFTVTFRGVTCIALHFTYFAVQGYDAYYYLQNYYLTCIFVLIIVNTSSPISNTAVVNRWQTTILNNPAGMINYGTNYSRNNFIIQAWPISYYLTPKNSIIAYNVTATPLNGTNFVLNISTSNSCSISQFGVSILTVNSTFLLQRSYNQYMDITQIDTVGNFTPYVPQSSTMTDFNTQYIYRNSLMGVYGCYFPIGSTPSLNYWYFNISTSNTSFLSGIAIQERMRSCGSTTPYYMYQQMLCYDNCPLYFYTNTTYNYCIACYFTCKQCSYSENYKNCTNCDANINRTLVNNSCICQSHYFDNNTLICASCFYSCLTCSNQKNNSCLSCDSNASRIFNNATTTCDCPSNYYENTTCYPCINSCIACMYVSLNSSVKCLQCNTSLNQVVNLNKTGCQCASGYSLFNLSCILVNPICGNGILESGESCDDDNTVSGDGCSSLCQIEEGCTCTYNVSIYPYSLCYFSSSVTFSTISVYKYPLQNKFKLIMGVFAPKCNQDLLRTYLQNHFSIEFASRNRLLISTDIISQEITYNPSTTTLTVDATYNQDIDLTTKLIKFSPSLAVTSTPTKYFYQSPITLAQLQKPSNLLLTTYLSSQQINTQKQIAFAYLGLIIFVWVFILVGVCYSQTAIAIEAMLIIQLSYQSLLQSGFIYEGWIGLIAYGKYTYGFNINVIESETNSDRLSIINLTSNLANTLNFTAGIIIIGVILLVSMLIYEMIKFHINTEEDFTASQAKITGILQSSTRHLSQERQNQQFYQLKKKWAVFILQVVFGLMFLTFKIVIITLLNISATSLTNTLAMSLTLLVCYSIIWYLYYRSYDLDFLRGLSFRKILRDKDTVVDNKDHWSFKFGNIFTKYYYLILFVFFAIFGIVDGALSIGAIFYVVAISIIIAFIVLLILFGIYFRKINLIRVVVNFLAMVTISILYLLQSIKINNTSQNLAIPILGLVILYIVAFVNFGIVVRIQYKKHRKIKNSKNKNKVKNLRLERKQTQQPQISLHQQIQLQLEQYRYDDLNFSREGMRKEQKESQSNYEDQHEQFAETKKKLNFKQKGDQLTKKKKLPKQFEQKDETMNGVRQLQECNDDRRQSQIQQHQNGAKPNPMGWQQNKNETMSVESPKDEIIDV